MKIFIDAFFHV